MNLIVIPCKKKTKTLYFGNNDIDEYVYRTLVIDWNKARELISWKKIHQFWLVGRKLIDFLQTNQKLINSFRPNISGLEVVDSVKRGNEITVEVFARVKVGEVGAFKFLEDCFMDVDIWFIICFISTQRNF